MGKNYYICNNSVADNLAALTVKNYRKNAKIADEVMRIITEFDGKVFNKKLESALSERIGRTFFVKYEKDYGRFEITLMYENRSVQSGEYSCVYQYEDSATLISSWDGSCIDNDKRIHADAINKKIADKKDEYLQRADRIEAGTSRIEEWTKRREAIANEWEELYKEIPSEIRAYYSINMSTSIL